MRTTGVVGVWLAMVAVWLGTPACGGLYDAAVLADSPVRYYRLGEAAGPTAFDGSTWAANGTYNNLAAGDFARPGAMASDPNTSVFLNGSPNVTITAADANELDIAGDIAIEFWYRKTAEAGDWQRIVGKGDSNANRRNYGVWEPGGADGRLLFQQYNSGGASVLNFQANTSTPANVWTHVVATVSGNAAAIYINGSLDATATRTGAPGTNADPLMIGHGQLHTWFPGYVDEVAVYNHALTAAQVRGHFDARLGLSPSYPSAVLEDGANAYYRFDDPSSASGSPAGDSADSNPATYRGNVILGPGAPYFGGSQAARFNGTTSYLNLPTAPFGAYPTSGNTNAYSLSFETWFQTSGNGVILGHTNNMGTPGGATPSGYVPAIYVDTTGRIRASMFWHNGTTNQIVSPGTYNDGDWHYLVDVYRNGTEFLYLDGTLIGQQVQNEFGYSAAYYYYLGTGYAAGGWPSTNGGWFFFSGGLDETALYPYALSLAEIESHYQLALTGIPEPGTMALLGLALGFLARRRRAARSH